MVLPVTAARSWLPPREIVTVTRKAIQAFSAHRVNRMAAALAYYTLFSLFPLLLLLLALIGFALDVGWPIALQARTYLIQATADLLPAAGDFVFGAIKSIQKARGTSGLIGALALLWSASNVLNHLHAALDQIWGFEGIPGLRLTVRRRLASIGIILSLGLLLVAAQALKSITFIITNVTDQVPGGSHLYSVATWVFPMIVAVLAFGAIFRVFPSVSISWYDVWPGAVLAGIGWESLKTLFGLYAVEFANWQAVYGPIASVIALLTWLYFSFTIMLFGAEFSAAYAARLRLAPEAAEVQPDRAVAEGEQVVALAEVETEGVQATKRQKSRTRPSLTAGTAAGVIGAVAAVGIGVGVLLGGNRRNKSAGNSQRGNRG